MAALTAALVLSQGKAQAAPQVGYAEAVDRALNIVRSAPYADRQAAGEAAAALVERYLESKERGLI